MSRVLIQEVPVGRRSDAAYGGSETKLTYKLFDPCVEGSHSKLWATKPKEQTIKSAAHGKRSRWIPACAGMTKQGLSQSLACLTSSRLCGTPQLAGGAVVLMIFLTTVAGSAFSQTPSSTISPMPGRSTVNNGYNPNPSAIKVARLHYSGGGDWYWGNSAIPNFLNFIRKESPLPVDTIERQVTIMDPELFKYPFLFATGHGVISFSAEEKDRLREYLTSGGFLFVNDSYGVDRTFRKEMAELFPEREVVEVPFDHPIYHTVYDFPQGPPKIHEHDNKPPRGYAIVVEGRVVLYFLVESDIGDGWEDSQVHNDPPEKRTEAFQMGLNLLTYALLY